MPLRMMRRGGDRGRDRGKGPVTRRYIPGVLLPHDAFLSGRTRILDLSELFPPLHSSARLSGAY